MVEIYMERPALKHIVWINWPRWRCDWKTDRWPLGRRFTNKWTFLPHTLPSAPSLFMHNNLWNFKTPPPPTSRSPFLWFWIFSWVLSKGPCRIFSLWSHHFPVRWWAWDFSFVYWRKWWSICKKFLRATDLVELQAGKPPGTPWWAQRS